MKTHITLPLNFLLATLTENHILVVFILKVWKLHPKNQFSKQISFTIPNFPHKSGNSHIKTIFSRIELTKRKGKKAKSRKNCYILRNFTMRYIAAIIQATFLSIKWFIQRTSFFLHVQSTYTWMHAHTLKVSSVSALMKTVLVF